MEKVSSALDPGIIEEDCSDEEDLSADEDEEMSDDGDPDDDMTLNQYQKEARRDTLIRKNSHTSEVSPKKGRVEAGRGGKLPLLSSLLSFLCFITVSRLIMLGYRISLFISFLMSTAKILFWNCRGISARDTYSTVLRLIKTLNPVLVCLVETQANSEHLDRFCNKIPWRWQWATILSDRFSGGIIVF